MILQKFGSRLARSTVGVVGLAGIAAGCAQPVAISPPAPTDAAITASCQLLAAKLPPELVGEQRRKVTPESPLTTAWGDPPITLTCGGTAPTFDPTTQLLNVNGIDWLPTEHENGYVFTTVDRSATARVSVPAAYRPEAEVLPALGAPISESIPAIS